MKKLKEIKLEKIDKKATKVYTDGCSKSNPGHSGGGIIIKDINNKILKTKG